jgi:RimJ/RimL family protein N-acetyltransferase
MLPRDVALRRGGSLTLRQGRVADAVGLVDYVNAVAAEGRYFLTDRLEHSMTEEHRWIRAHDGGPGGLLIVVVDGEGKVVGNLSATRSKYSKGKHRAQVGLGMLPPYRGQGVGRALLEECVVWAKAHKVSKLSLEVFSSNRRAIALYRSFGFVDDGTNRRHHKINGRYVDNLHMALFLDPPRGR